MNPIEQGWYQGKWYSHWYNFLLLPLCLLFWLISSLRRLAFKLGIKKSHKAPKPVVIVGNISVGGNGKTPFVIWLVNYLKQHNIRAGVISRGYGSNSAEFPLAVTAPFNTNVHGDEPVLIAQRCDCPVVIGPDRVVTSDYISQHFDIDIIICDDGMQHYRLKRDIEIAIVDSKREFGNGWLMPIGPLREFISRLNEVNYVVYNGINSNPQAKADTSFALECGDAINLLSNQAIDIKSIKGKIHGLCAIGNPARFENTLNDYLKAHHLSIDSFTPFTDHHAFSAGDFTKFGEDNVFMTEKDAVKCQSLATANWHYLPVNARLPQAFEKALLADIKSRLSA